MMSAWTREANASMEKVVDVSKPAELTAGSYNDFSDRTSRSEREGALGLEGLMLGEALRCASFAARVSGDGNEFHRG